MFKQNNDDPFYLIRQKKFDEAIKIYSEKLNNKLHAPSLANRGTAYLNIGDFDSALKDFKKAEEIYNKEMPDRADGYLKLVGLTLWLKGEKNEAANLWCNLARDLDAKKIVFSDSAGVLSGTLLWYASFTKEINQFRELAEKYLNNRIKLSSIKHWPGPVAQYLLGRIFEEGLIKAAHSNSEILTHRQLCQAYFYIGVKALSNSDLENFQKNIAKSVTYGETSLLEIEYYLAKNEMDRLESDIK